MNISKNFRDLYFNKSELTQKQMSVSRIISIFEGCTARTIFTITGGAFLVGFAGYLGASDQVAGIISAIPTLSGIIMMLSARFFEHLENRKLSITLFCLFGRLLLASMIIIPFISKTTGIRVALLIGVFLIANLLISFMLPAAQTWIASVTPGAVRGRYFGIREACILAFVTVVSIIAGRVLDIFKRSGNELNGFKLLYFCIFIVVILNFLLFSFMGESRTKVCSQKTGILRLLAIPLKDKSFLKVMILLAVWNASFQLATPFSAVYMVSGLKLNYTYITIMTSLASAVSVIFVIFWGRLADRTSWLFLIKLLNVSSMKNI